MQQIIKTAPGIGLVSSAFFMLLPDRVYVFGDCAINVEPSAEDLADIAIASAYSARAFGVKRSAAQPPRRTKAACPPRLPPVTAADHGYPAQSASKRLLKLRLSSRSGRE